MLVFNGRLVFNNPQRFGGTYANQNGNIVKGGNRNRFVGGLDSKFGGYPNGHLAPSSFILPQKSGSISSYREAQEFIAGVANLTPAQPMTASATLEITLTNAQLDQIVQAIASGTISIVVSQAILAGAANANASGTCTLTVNSALCGAIFSVLANSSGVITPSVTISALAHMNAEAGGPTPLSPEGLASAVWGASAADNNDTGTMGEKVNDASAAGNPWSADLASNNTAGTFGAFVQKLLTVAKFLGLK